MIQTRLYNHFISHRAKLEKNFQRVRATQSVVAIHDMRVNIKQIKALLRLIGHLQAKNFPWKQHFKNLQILFKSAGQLRDIQVQENLIQQYEKNQQVFYFSYVALLLKHKKNAQNSLLEMSKHFRPEQLDKTQELLKDLIFKLEESWIINKTQTYLQAKLQEVKCLLHQLKEEEDIHQIRKNLKEVFYLQTWLQVSSKETLPKPWKRLKNSTESLGQWHDRVVMLDYLHSLAQRKESVFQLNKYQRLEKKIMLESQRYLKQFEKTMPKHFEQWSDLQIR